METYRGAVGAWETDQIGKLDKRYYMSRCDLANSVFLAAIGGTENYARLQRREFKPVQMDVSYQADLVEGDAVTIETRLLGHCEKSVTFRHELKCAETGKVAATADIRAEHHCRVSRRAAPIPPEIMTLVELHAPAN